MAEAGEVEKVEVPGAEAAVVGLVALADLEVSEVDVPEGAEAEEVFNDFP